MRLGMGKRIVALALVAAIVSVVLPGDKRAYARCDGGGVSSIATGVMHALAISVDGSLWAWGSNLQGEVGDGTTVSSASPLRIMENVNFIAAGGSHSMAIKADGSLWAWGSNRSGQLGDGTTTNRHSPVRILENVVYVAAGSSHSFAICSDGSLWAWGGNYFGGLGDGTTINRHSPVRIMENVVSVAAGEGHSFAIRSDGSLWTWGTKWNRQLSLERFIAGPNFLDIVRASSLTLYTPIHLMDNVVSASAGRYHSMAIKNDGSLWVWGENPYGQLGFGTLDNASLPARIMENVVSINAGIYSSFAICSDGSLWAWGQNIYGQLGDGTSTDRLSPIHIMENIICVASIYGHGFAIREDGSLWAWGHLHGVLGMTHGNALLHAGSPVRIMDGMMISDCLPTPTPQPTPQPTPTPTPQPMPTPQPVVPVPTSALPPTANVPFAHANAAVHLRSTPTMRPDGTNISNANVVMTLRAGERVEIIDQAFVRAWRYTDVSRRYDIGFIGPSRWVNVRTAGGAEGFVYIAFLDF